MRNERHGELLIGCVEELRILGGRQQCAARSRGVDFHTHHPTGSIGILIEQLGPLCQITIARDDPARDTGL